MTTPVRIFIGYDAREAVAFHVLSHSILRHASRPVAIVPLVQEQLRAGGMYTRDPDLRATTAFSLTRFLVPALSGYDGISVFMDCDMLCQTDLAFDALLYPLGFPTADVFCAPHDYVPKTTSKFFGATQEAYPRKNWSSFMIFNNARCKALSVEAVNTQTPAWLHRMEWAREIGQLPLTMNWLVGEYEEQPDAEILHYTLGGPWCTGLVGEEADRWHAEQHRMLGVVTVA